MNTYFLSIVGSCQPNIKSSRITGLVKNKVYSRRNNRFIFDSGFWEVSVEKKGSRIKIELQEEGLVSSFSFGDYELQEGISKLVSRYQFPKKNLILRWTLILSS
jgi:hypothetical protein